MTEALPSGTEAALVAQSGDLVYPAQLDRTPGWDVALAAAPQRPAGAFVREEAGELFLYAHAPVAHTTWGLTFRWPYRLLDVSLERQASLLLLILALGGLLAVAVGYASSRFLTRPIGELLEAVRALVTARTSGEAPPACALQAVGRADELGELARAFEQLRSGLAEGDALHRQDLERIRELASSLEDRVRERTAELEAAQRSLVAQERLAAMGRAAAVISHELKNSLNAVGMGFELVALEANRLPHLARVNAQVRAEVDRLRTLTDELLVFARVPRLQTAPADLNDMVRRTALFCAEQALTAGVSIEQKLTGDGAPLAVPCDTKLIGSVLLNLVQNAIEAVAWTAAEDAPRKVVVSTDATWGSDGSGFALFAVEDTGPGVAAEVRPHLFEPFFTTKRNGTGLGLATAQRFASAHGGHIDLESSKLGGARFVVRLPVRQPHGPPKAAA
jgi:signal transduction histidine kinase